MEPLFEIEIDPPAKGSRRSADNVFGQLKSAIVDGRLARGAKLPPTRCAESLFGISRNTAGRVYEKLEREGFVVTRHGSGSYVASTRAAPSDLGARTPADSRRRRINGFWTDSHVIASMNFWRDAASAPEQPTNLNTAAIDFRPVMVDSSLFPFDRFRQSSAKQLRSLEKRRTSGRSLEGNQGSYPLRRAISQHLAVTRAIVCHEDQVIVTSGAQQAFDLLARVLVVPNETVVAFEDPGYPPMRMNFAAAGAKLVPVGVDAQGLIVEQLPEDAGIICVTPSHQFPLGISMSPRRRKALLDFARQRGAVILEDDYDGEFRHEHAPIEALRGADTADVVCHVGTFSKSMFPALRLGFVVAPKWLTPTLVTAKNCMDWHCSMPLQRAVAGFIEDGHLWRHVRKMRALYKQRRDLMLELLQSGFSDWLNPLPSQYGMHIAAVAAPSAGLEAATAKLRRHSINIHTLKRYFHGPETQHGLIFGYGSVDLAQIRDGLAKLYDALGS